MIFLLAIIFLYVVCIYGGIACIMICDWIGNVIKELRKKPNSK